jgi:predicted TPR repeat methyltransferase
MQVVPLYIKALENAPQNCQSWVKFAELERSLGETERARAVFELAITQPMLDMPEVGGCTGSRIQLTHSLKPPGSNP